MALLTSVLLGLFTSFLRVIVRRHLLTIPNFRLSFLVPAAVIPQLLAFHLPATNSIFSDEAAALILLISQSMLLVFAWINRRQAGFCLLGLGLMLNLLVIIANGGWMPISPETIRAIAPNSMTESWQLGQRLGSSKDIVLPTSQIRLYWLTDRLLLSKRSPYQVAFSFGDVVIALGAFWTLWSVTIPKEKIN